MPPIVVVTNGIDNEFYTTYDKKKWEPSTIDEETLQRVFKQILEMAATDKDEAVRLLLSTNEGIWEEIILQLNQRNLESKIGELQNFSKPVVTEFQIPRKITETLRGMLLKKVPLITLIGEPLSGKTNI